MNIYTLLGASAFIFLAIGQIVIALNPKFNHKFTWGDFKKGPTMSLFSHIGWSGIWLAFAALFGAKACNYSINTHWIGWIFGIPLIVLAAGAIFDCYRNPE